MSKLYRILTEDKDREKVIQLVSEVSGGFTLIEAQGYWKGVAEKSIVIEIDNDDITDVDIKELAEKIRHANNQECVLVQVMHVMSQLIYA